MPNPVTTIYVTCKDLFFTISSFFSHLVKGSLKIEIESNFYSLQDSLVPETVNRKSCGGGQVVVTVKIQKNLKFFRTFYLNVALYLDLSKSQSSILNVLLKIIIRRTCFQ